MYSATIGSSRYAFPDLKTLLAKASPLRSGDGLAGVAATSGEERVAAQYALADLPLATFLAEQVVPYESDEVTRLIVDSHDHAAFAVIAHFTVGGLRDWLLSDASTTDALAELAPGIMQEMAAAVSKFSRLQDLMVMAAKCAVVTRFRNTIGLPGRLSVRLQPNHPTDDLAGIAARFSMAFCSAPAMPSSASIPPPTARSGRTRCSPCLRSCGSSSTCRPRAACWRT